MNLKIFFFANFPFNQKRIFLAALMSGFMRLREIFASNFNGLYALSNRMGIMSASLGRAARTAVFDFVERQRPSGPTMIV
ncbi:hypothetical protein [Mesorhizobium sp. M8A.F.Ca.ET.165.01.1.1]|uniref:hypothetical protein n=1 Tax=Mesorhizobium sp. M8A.F.Ca.ET.165.01.1.1 TaxID=2563960 RepID=UPI001093E661|nr:hypothetical protein [Mesorhizobium sp. M8A.F.Ca.ET.165.01.1.1]TGT46348.1 hypothetical protein EN808_03425 [Mesorhizobium sp. M8A.F.Ca.ET.165.01.1.1]